MTTQSPIRFSIIIPHYNIPKLLQRCLDSIPQRPDLEVIVVDDNSDPEIVDFDHFPGSDRSDVKLILDKKGAGGGYARNLGLDTARGKWIIFSDADDLFVKDFLVIIDSVSDSPVDLIFFRSLSVKSTDLSPASKDYYNPAFIQYEKDGELDRLKIFYSVPWGKMYKRAFIDAYHIRFSEVPVCNDWYFSLLTAFQANDILIDNRAIYMYALREGSVSQNATRLARKTVERIKEYAACEKYIHAKGWEFYPMRLRNLMADLLKYHQLDFIRMLVYLRKQGIPCSMVLSQVFSPKFIRHIVGNKPDNLRKISA